MCRAPIYRYLHCFWAKVVWKVNKCLTGHFWFCCYKDFENTQCKSGERLVTSHFVRLDIYLHVEITTFLLFGYKTNTDFSVFLEGFGGSPWAPPLALQQKLTINEIYIYFGICPDDRSYWYNRIYKKKLEKLVKIYQLLV